MELYTQKRRWKYSLLFAAILIGIISVWYTNNLMDSLSKEERKRIELWAKATQEFINSSVEEDVNAVAFEVIESNETIPVIVVDNENNIVGSRNLDSTKMDNPEYRKRILEKFKNNGNDSFPIILNEETLNTVYYSDSSLLEKITFFPYLQLGIVFLFIIFAYFVFSVSRKAEQNNVWLGMSKETAHQLGTPISSLMAWIEILKNGEQTPELINEVEKDINRLEKISSRFSKIGSIPKLEICDVVQKINNSAEYIRTRIHKNISIEITETNPVILIPLNADLFEWVIENICKNAADAIGSNGKITIKITENHRNIYIDISDTGKGISRKNQKNVFQPGFTTKKRGWGLGLSLVKRIIEQYHSGKVFVKNSEIGIGTTFRIILKK
ncbi:MAG: HAMP domain-containing histidine kinase [Bacteroidales bacterium]|jgi:two-component sensor histidine kinase|nr:HAMP domain-containing histidine kinase [Bacteroidales bacterium]